MDEAFANRLESVPLWLIFVATVLMGVLALECGFRVSRVVHRGRPTSETSLRTIVSGILLLLALVLSFTVQLVATQFSNRRQAILAEAVTLRTTWIRVGFLPEDEQKAFRDLLREYVDVRLNATYTGHYLESIKRSEEIQREFWRRIIEFETAHSKTPEISQLTKSIADLTEVHVRRINAARGVLAKGLWIYIYSLVALSMMMVGYHLGVTGRREAVGVLFLVLAFSLVVALIADLDQPTHGFFRSSIADLENLRAEMQ
jgi:hypothetical protein